MLHTANAPRLPMQPEQGCPCVRILAILRYGDGVTAPCCSWNPEWVRQMWSPLHSHPRRNHGQSQLSFQIPFLQERAVEKCPSHSPVLAAPQEQGKHHHWHLSLPCWGSLLTRELLSTGDGQSRTQTPAMRDVCMSLSSVKDIFYPGCDRGCISLSLLSCRNGPRLLHRAGLGTAPVWDW